MVFSNQTFPRDGATTMVETTKCRKTKIFDTLGINLMTYILIEIMDERGNSEMPFDKMAFDKVTFDKMTFDKENIAKCCLMKWHLTK